MIDKAERVVQSLDQIAAVADELRHNRQQIDLADRLDAAGQGILEVLIELQAEFERVSVDASTLGPPRYRRKASGEKRSH